jgi:hypothetical protein
MARTGWMISRSIRWLASLRVNGVSSSGVDDSARAVARRASRPCSESRVYGET